MRRRAIVLVTVMMVTLLACAGVVLAQATEEGHTKPASSSQQGAESDVIPGHYIVVLKDDGAEQGSAQDSGGEQEARQVANELSREGKVEEITHTYGSAPQGFAAQIPEGNLSEVENDPRVEFVVADREIYATAQTLPTGVDRVDADLSSTVAGDGSEDVDVDIAIIDSGIYAKHPDLNVAGGVDCANDGKNTFWDDYRHGTHVAGSAAARDNTIGVVGTAPGARLWSVKVLNSIGRGTTSDVTCGVDWVTERNTDGDTTNDIEVANMSLGATVSDGNADDGDCGLTNDDPVHQAICASVDADVTYVVAADNSVSDVQHDIPAAYDEVITVSALTDYNGQPGGGAPRTCNHDRATDDDFAFFSNFSTLASDRAHMLGAPGVCIESTFFTKKKKGKKKKIVPSYATLSGTSMASPHVAGAAALHKSLNPAKTPADIRAFMLAQANSEALGQGHTGRSGLNPEPVLQMDNY